MLAVFILSGKTPDEKERLSKSTDRLFAIQSFGNFMILLGMLLYSAALLLLRSDIMSVISLFLHG